MPHRPEWLHCNICQVESAASFFMTSCGKVCCGSCKRYVPNSRIIEINNRAPKEVLKLFSDVEALIKDAYKIFDFQQAQQRMQLENKRREVARLKAEADAIEERDKADRERLEQLRQEDLELDKRIEFVEAEIEKYRNRDYLQTDSSSGNLANGLSEVSLFSDLEGTKSRHVEELFQKLGSPTPEDWHSRGAGSSSQLNFTRRSEGDESCDVKEDKFLEMKTPAAWHKSRHTRPQPHKRSSLTPEGEGYFDTTTALWIKKLKTNDFFSP